MKNEGLEGRVPVYIPEQLVTGLADYILCASLEQLTVHGFEDLTESRWEDFAELYTGYTRSKQRILSRDEHIALFVEASRLAFDIHQEIHLEGTSEKLKFPAHFRGRVSEVGWSYIQEYYDDQYVASEPPSPN